MNARTQTEDAHDNEYGRKDELFETVSNWLIPAETSKSSLAHIAYGEIALPLCGNRRANHTAAESPDGDLEVCNRCLETALNRELVPTRFATVLDPDYTIGNGMTITDPTEAYLQGRGTADD